MDDAKVEEALDDCNSALTASNCPFTAWEKEFVESVGEQWEERQFLSEKQRDTLRRVWDKV
jgi:hypothetical protein